MVFWLRDSEKKSIACIIMAQYAVVARLCVTFLTEAKPALRNEKLALFLV